ncbi:GTPase, partial [Enterocloster bolteae]|uniref:GTPase n=1 Tax=Enterocloster bolteae TaxID=208479 RepID=UPI00210C6294
MGKNNTPASDRIHIGFFGRRNAGKSSVLNAVTGQDLAVVSDVKGTTTDPVYKAMELLPLALTDKEECEKRAKERGTSHFSAKEKD